MKKIFQIKHALCIFIKIFDDCNNFDIEMVYDFNRIKKKIGDKLFMKRIRDLDESKSRGS